MSDETPAPKPERLETSPAAAEPDSKPAPADRSNVGLRLTGAAVLFAGALAVAAYFLLAPLPPPSLTGLPAADPEMASRLAVVEAQLAQRPREAPPGAAAPSPEIAAMAERLAGLERAAGEGRTSTATAVETLRKELAASDEKRANDMANLAAQLSATETPQDKALELRLRAIEERVVGLTGTLEKLQGDLATAAKALADRAQADAGAAARLASAESRVAVTQAAVRLRGALNGSAPFTADLAAAKAAAANNPALLQALVPLDAHAAKGLQTVDMLRLRFQEVAGEALGASVAPADDGGWASGILRRLGSAVSIRPVGEVAGSGTDAIVARAEARLAGDDLAGAVAVLGELKEPAAVAAVAPWLDSARARLAGEAALRAMLADGAAARP